MALCAVSHRARGGVEMMFKLAGDEQVWRETDELLNWQRTQSQWIVTAARLARYNPPRALAGGPTGDGCPMNRPGVGR